MTFDYAASAELYMPKGKPGARRVVSYRRFATAADAIRFAVEDFPAIRMLGVWMRVGDERASWRRRAKCSPPAAYDDPRGLHEFAEVRTCVQQFARFAGIDDAAIRSGKRRPQAAAY